MARTATSAAQTPATPHAPIHPILLAAMARRTVTGMKVVMQTNDGEPFTYWPKTAAQKADFIRRALKTGATILEQ